MKKKKRKSQKNNLFFKKHMQLIKDFLQTKAARRAFWTFINMIMSIILSFVVYAASENVAWAVSILPFAQMTFQYLTKEINNRIG